MTEFTIEELKEILFSLKSWSHPTTYENYIELTTKVKSIIEEKEHEQWIKHGNKSWVFTTDYGRDSWGEFDTVVYPSELELVCGDIVFVSEKDDLVQIKTPISDDLIQMGYTFFHEWAYPTKELAIKGMMKRMEELMHE